MYRFQISAVTRPEETIALVGSSVELGQWDVARCVRLRTSRDRYPLWWADIDWRDRTLAASGDRPVEYKYVRLGIDGSIAWETLAANRWVPLEQAPLPSPIIVDDGQFGIGQPSPYGYWAEPDALPVAAPSPEGLKIVVIGSSVALGCSAWLWRGWAWHLGQALQQRYGHQLVNVSAIGTNVATTIARFSQVVGPERPDIVIIALSLGNEGLATSAPEQYRAIQRRFENGLQQLIKMTQAMGARPVLGGVYPHGGYSLDQYHRLRETHQRMLTWGLPVLNWLAVLNDGRGRWKPGLSFDLAHPNTDGQYRMYEVIDLTQFQLTKADLATDLAIQQAPLEDSLLYQDPEGFLMFARPTEPSLQIINTSGYYYTLTPDWQKLQTAIRAAKLPSGLYIAASPNAGTVSSLFIRDDGSLETTLSIPPAADLRFYPAFHFFASEHAKILFYDGYIGILKVSDRHLYGINESDHDYNIHPMWKEIRAALKAMPAGVYADAAYPDVPFRTMMIGQDGLESRVKIPAKSVLGFAYQGSLSEVSRVAIIPLGDRCAVRMLLYKLEYDGPAFPFDLTRSTQVADVADIIQSGFDDMWNPGLLHYDPEASRIYHTKWTGLSFAHEVEDSDDPMNTMASVHERMKSRYSARAKRFWYTLQTCDKVLFVRTGLCDRNSVADLVHKLEMKCQGKPFWLLLISPQASDEFADLANVRHYNLEFNPDLMYEDLGHWQHCTELMGEILDALGVSSKNLFWCPPTPPKAS